MYSMLKKALIPLFSLVLASPVMADWPVAVADKFIVHPSHEGFFTKLDLLKNDIGSNLKVVSVNTWSEEGAKVSLVDAASRGLEGPLREGNIYGDVSYVPKAGFVGRDGFWYVIEDDQGRRNAIRVVVDVKSASSELPAPQDDSFEILKDTPTRINPLSNDLFTNVYNGYGKQTFRGKIAYYNYRSAKGGKVEKIEVYPLNSLYFSTGSGLPYSTENSLKYQFKYTPPAGFVGVDTFTYAVKDSTNSNYGGSVEINDRVRWAQVTLKVGNSTNKGPWPVAGADKGAHTNGDFFSIFDVLKNDSGKNLTLKVDRWTQKGAKVEVVPNHPDRPVIRYIAPSGGGFVGTDKFWYVVEDEYGRTNYSFVDVTVTN